MSTAAAGRPVAGLIGLGLTAPAVSWANCQTLAGRQNLRSNARQPIETRAARMSVNSGPTKFDTRN